VIVLILVGIVAALGYLIRLQLNNPLGSDSTGDAQGIESAQAPGLSTGPAGNAIGPDAPAPGSLHNVHAVMVLHPPQETVPTLPEDDGVASGCLFLPGIPELGLFHRATWVEADRDGNGRRSPPRRTHRCRRPPRGKATRRSPSSSRWPPAGSPPWLSSWRCCSCFR
jgi:hypothetical protein